MDVEIFALCDRAVDYNGKLCILGTFDTLSGPGFPLTHSPSALVFRVRFASIEAGAHKFRIQWVNEDGHAFMPPIEGEASVQMPPANGSAAINLVVNVLKLVVPRPGRYSVDLAIDGRQVHSLPLWVVQAAPPPPRPAPPGAGG